MNAEKLQNLLLYRYRYLISYIVIVATSMAVLFYRLERLVPGLSQDEAAQGLSVATRSTAILDQGVNLPYNLVQHISILIFGESILALRVASALFAFLTLLMLFVLIHKWHKDKIAITSIFIFATSSWFLTIARIGVPHIFQAFCIVLLFLAGAQMRHTQRPKLALIFTAFALACAFYAPMMIYFIILFVAIYYSEIRHSYQKAERSDVIIGAIVGLVAILPLFWGFLQDFENVKSWLGVPGGLPSPVEALRNMFDFVQHIFWASNFNPMMHLGNLAMLDIFTSTMAALGLWHYERHFNQLRTRFIVYGLGLALIVFGLTNREGNYIIVAPLLYILAATGIVTLLNQWNKIFPINPFARTLALIPLGVAILITSQYHLDRYFSAWALNPNVRQTYAIEPALLEDAIDNSEKQHILIITKQREHGAIRYLLHDSDKQLIDLTTPELAEDTGIDDTRYDEVYLDGDVDSGIRNNLNKYISSKIESPRDTKPVAYRVFDLSAKVGRVFTP